MISRNTSTKPRNTKVKPRKFTRTHPGDLQRFSPGNMREQLTLMGLISQTAQIIDVPTMTVTVAAYLMRSSPEKNPSEMTRSDGAVIPTKSLDSMTYNGIQ